MVNTSGLGLFVLISVALLALLLRERSHRRRLEERLAKTREGTSAAALSLHALENEILANHSREQRRISNELHNGVSQNLAGIALLLKSLEGRMQAESPENRAEITQIAELIHRTSAKTQDLVLGREDTDGTSEASLSTALRELAANIQLLFRIPCRFEGKVDPHLKAVSVNQLLAIATEAVHNAVRHANADHIVLQLKADGETLVVGVEDDGSGLTGETRDLHSRGHRVMAERTERLGGQLAILARPPRGTRVECRIPYPGVPEEA